MTLYFNIYVDDDVTTTVKQQSFGMTMISASAKNTLISKDTKSKSCNFTSYGNKCQNKEWTTTR